MVPVMKMNILLYEDTPKYDSWLKLILGGVLALTFILGIIFISQETEAALAMFGITLIVQTIIFPLIFLSGIFFPVSNVPTWLEAISKINPLTYGVDAIRQLFLGSEIAAIGGGNGSYVIGVTVLGHTMTIFEDVLIVAIFGVVMLLIAAWSFSKQE